MDDPTYEEVVINRYPIWRLAFFLSELYNDNAPIGWSKYAEIAERAIEEAKRVKQ